MYYQQALQAIQKGHFDPAYLIYGDEFFLVDNLIRLFKEKFLGKPDPELNFFVRYASEEGADAVLSLGAGMGLFANKKIILLKEAQALKKSDIDRLIKFLSKPAPDTLILLQSPVTSLYQTRLKKLEPLVTSIQVLPLRPADLKNFIREEFTRQGKSISDEAVELLLFMVGPQLADLMVQINHLVNYFSEKATIETTDVEEVASVYVTQDVFQLNRLMGNKEKEKAFFVLHNLLDSGIAPQQILYQIQRHFSILWRIQGYYRSGMHNNEAIARELNIFSRYFPEYAAQSRKWKPESLKKIVSLLKNADKQLKDNQMTSKIILDILSQQILNS